MTEPIRGQPPAQPLASLDVPAMANRLQDLLGQFSQQLQNLLNDPTQAKAPNFHRTFNRVIVPLRELVDKSVNL